MNRGNPSHEDLARIAVPTLLLWGEEDELVPLECGQAAASPDVGHISSIEAPDDFVRAVSGFAST